MFPNVSRGFGIALALMGLELIAIVAVACGGGESKSVETAAPKVAAPTAVQPAQPVATRVVVAAATAPTATQPAQPVATRVAGAAAAAPTAAQPAQPVATRVAGAVTQAAPFTGDALARLEALMREEFAGLTNENLPRLDSVQVRQEPDGSYRVAVEFVSDDVRRTGDEREVILARKRLMEERMQHAFRTLYTSGIDVNNALIGAKFKTAVKTFDQGGARAIDAYALLYTTWMTREKAAGVNWADPSLDLRTVWEAPLVHPSYR